MKGRTESALSRVNRQVTPGFETDNTGFGSKISILNMKKVSPEVEGAEVVEAAGGNPALRAGKKGSAGTSLNLTEAHRKWFQLPDIGENGAHIDPVGLERPMET